MAATPEKPTPIRVSSDDCTVAVTEGGPELALHGGEWVEVILGGTVGNLRATRGLMELRGKLDSLDEGNDDTALRKAVLADDAYSGMLDLVKARVTAWSWTDDRGFPLPQPLHDPDVFLRLREEEVFYLALVIMENNPDTEKNGSRPSPIISSDTAPQRHPTKSGGGRSRSRVS